MDGTTVQYKPYNSLVLERGDANGGQDRIEGRAIDGLSGNPRPPGVRKLVGHESLYRIRVGQYRVVYDIDDQGRSIRITRIRHRREVYR